MKDVGNHCHAGLVCVYVRVCVCVCACIAFALVEVGRLKKVTIFVPMYFHLYILQLTNHCFIVEDTAIFEMSFVYARFSSLMQTL